MPDQPFNRQLARVGFDRLPIPIAAAGDRARWRFIEFFAANIRNLNTRRAYARAVRNFFEWCEQYRITRLEQINPTVVAAYVEQFGESLAKPTVKQHLAAVRVFFDWLKCIQISTLRAAAANPILPQSVPLVCAARCI